MTDLSQGPSTDERLPYTPPGLVELSAGRADSKSVLNFEETVGAASGTAS